MTTKHTPWRVTKGGFEIKEVTNENKLVAICTEKEYATLIAAAPELLEALEMVMDCWIENPATNTHPKAVKARAAIAKAKGRE